MLRGEIMFKKKVSMEEFVQGIYMLGYNQYNHLIEWFNSREIEVENNQMFFLCELIITKIMEKVSKEKKFKLNGNLTDEITELLHKSIDSSTTTSDREILENYISVVKDDIHSLIGDGSKKIVDLVDFFLSEITWDTEHENDIRLFLVNLFGEWQNICCEFTAKFKII